MSKSLSNIVVVTTTELLNTSIDSYFRQIALIHEFDDTYLITGQSFSVAGFEEYETIDDVAVKFPSASKVYKWAESAFAQKTGSGVNGSVFEKLIIIQKKSTDTTYLDALNRIAYKDAYWMIPLTDTVAEVQSVDSFISTKYMQLLTQDDSADILNPAVATDIASVLNTAGATRSSVWYHADETDGLVSAIAAIMASSNPGDKSAFYKTPSGITVDTIVSTGLSSLDAKHANYYTKLEGTAGNFNSNNLTFNGVLVNGDKIQKTYQTDRIILTLQTSLIDALKMDIPYDNRGGAIVEKAVKNVLKGFFTQELIKDQPFENDYGSTVVGYYAKVEKTEDTRTNSPSDYASQTFRVHIEYLLALTAEKIKIYITYSV